MQQVSVLLLLRLARLLDRDADTAVQAWHGTQPGSTADQNAAGAGLSAPRVCLSLARPTLAGTVAVADDGGPPRYTVPGPGSPSRLPQF